MFQFSGNLIQITESENAVDTFCEIKLKECKIYTRQRKIYQFYRIRKKSRKKTQRFYGQDDGKGGGSALWSLTVSSFKKEEKVFYQIEHDREELKDKALRREYPMIRIPRIRIVD